MKICNYKLDIYELGKIVGAVIMLIAVIVACYKLFFWSNQINIWAIFGLGWLGSSISWQSAYYGAEYKNKELQQAYDDLIKKRYGIMREKYDDM